MICTQQTMVPSKPSSLPSLYSLSRPAKFSVLVSGSVYFVSSPVDCCSHQVHQLMKGRERSQVSRASQGMKLDPPKSSVLPSD